MAVFQVLAVLFFTVTACAADPDVTACPLTGQLLVSLQQVEECTIRCLYLVSSAPGQLLDSVVSRDVPDPNCNEVPVISFQPLPSPQAPQAPRAPQVPQAPQPPPQRKTNQKQVCVSVPAAELDPPLSSSRRIRVTYGSVFKVLQASQVSGSRFNVDGEVCFPRKGRTTVKVELDWSFNEMVQLDEYESKQKMMAFWASVRSPIGSPMAWKFVQPTDQNLRPTFAEIDPRDGGQKTYEIKYATLAVVARLV